jgi:nucleotide-binding universal stress UspA family protein
MSMTHTSTAAGQPFSAETLKPTGPVLVALKPSEGGDAALAVAQWLAHNSDAELNVLSIADTIDDTRALAAGIPPLPQEYHLRERAEATLRRKAEAAAGPHGTASCRVDVIEGPTSTTIAHTARDRGARVIVVGTGRHAVLGRFFYGERALEVVRSAVGPVLAVPPTARVPFGHAMVAVDFSQASMRAAVTALDMLGPAGRLSLVHVKSALRLDERDAGWWNDAYELKSRDMLARFADALPEPPGVMVDTALLHGDPVSALRQFVDEHAVDLIACGRRRHSLVERILVGSVSTALVRRAAHSVLVAPERSYDKDMDDASWMTGVRVSRDREDWPEWLRGISRRNAGRRAQLVLETECLDGVESVEKGYSFLAAEYEPTDHKVTIVLGDRDVPGSQLTHRIAGLREPEMVANSAGKDTRVQLDAVPGRCILSFVDAR